MVKNSSSLLDTYPIFYTVMAMLLMFLFTSGLLEVGQSNWDVLNLNCFANLYTALYT